MDETKSQPIPFKAETRQLLDILIHSLYTEREIFLRELLSNASDALTRMSYEQLTNREVRDPQAELLIRILPNKEEQTLTIRDTGLGMTGEEMAANLGTIAHSGAREFIAAAQNSKRSAEGRSLSDLIGQFGVGFYSAFMAAEWIRVVSLSFDPQAQAAAWFSSGADTYTVEPAEKENRGTDVILKLNAESLEYLEEGRLREIIRKHSDFIPYPIYIGEDEEQANRQTAIWRQLPREVEAQAYDDFYRQFTLDFEAPLAHIHMSVDAPVQMYALLYIPASAERNMFSLRKEEGLKLYARKVLIQEYNKDLLPEYLGFVQGVVDSEDIPLSVSREAAQSTRAIGQIKKLITGKVIDTLKKMGQDDPEKYNRFWEAFDRYIKQGIAIEPGTPDSLYPLLRFHTNKELQQWTALDQYVDRMPAGQEKIYYILGDDDRSVLYSPHLDSMRHHNYEVLLLTDPVDPFMLARLKTYRDKPLENVATANLELPAEAASQDEKPALAEDERATLIERFKETLGERVTDVRMTTRLVDSPARLVDPEGAPNQEMQRVYRLMNKDFEAPKKVLELNPRHPILMRLNEISAADPLNTLVIEQLYEDALLIEGLHPDPAGMIQRIQKLMEAVLGNGPQKDEH